MTKIEGAPRGRGQSRRSGDWNARPLERIQRKKEGTLPVVDALARPADASQFIGNTPAPPNPLDEVAKDYGPSTYFDALQRGQDLTDIPSNVSHRPSLSDIKPGAAAFTDRAREAAGEATLDLARAGVVAASSVAHGVTKRIPEGAKANAKAGVERTRAILEDTGISFGEKVKELSDAFITIGLPQTRERLKSAVSSFMEQVQREEDGAIPVGEAAKYIEEHPEFVGELARATGRSVREVASNLKGNLQGLAYELSQIGEGYANLPLPLKILYPIEAFAIVELVAACNSVSPNQGAEAAQVSRTPSLTSTIAARPNPTSTEAGVSNEDIRRIALDWSAVNPNDRVAVGSDFALRNDGSGKSVPQTITYEDKNGRLYERIRLNGNTIYTEAFINGQWKLVRTEISRDTGDSYSLALSDFGATNVPRELPATGYDPTNPARTDTPGPSATIPAATPASDESDSQMMTATAGTATANRPTGTPTSPPKTVTPQPSVDQATATKAATVNPAELQKQLLSSEFTSLNNTSASLPDRSGNHEKINFTGYRISNYASPDGYPIMVATGGTNGLQSGDLAQQVVGWIDWSVQASPTIRSIIDRAKVRFYVFDTPTLFAMNNASQPQLYGQYWGVEMTSDYLTNPNHYGSSGVKYSPKGWFLAMWKHELVRLFNQNIRSQNQWGMLLSTQPQEGNITTELISAAGGDQETINALSR